MAIRNTALNYIEGWYAGSADRMAPALCKLRYAAIEISLSPKNINIDT